MSETVGPDAWAVILAGGAGTRLQAFVRHALASERPKQFLRIIGSRSMLRHTWDRAVRIAAPERLVTVITAGQEGFLAEEAAHGIPGTLLVQPDNKETAPGLMFALLWIEQRAPTASIVVFPADHFIWEEERFAAHVRAALEAARRMPGRLVLLGVEADGPSTDYGWIAPGEPLAAGPAAELYAVRRFWEKPDRPTAARLFACGYFWNTLVLAGPLQAYLGLAAAALPQVLDNLRIAAAAAGRRQDRGALARAYARVPATNLSRAVLARHPEGLAVLAARGVCWSDWGDPERIMSTLRRFDRRPCWLPGYLRSRTHGAAEGCR